MNPPIIYPPDCIIAVHALASSEVLFHIAAKIRASGNTPPSPIPSKIEGIHGVVSG